jgi:hypothetical protein
MAPRQQRTSVSIQGAAAKETARVLVTRSPQSRIGRAQQVMWNLQICRDTMTNWALGKRELPPDHSIFAALVVLVHFHEKAVAKARRIMEHNRI